MEATTRYTTKHNRRVGETGTAHNWGLALWWADEQGLYICISMGLLVHGLGRRALITTTTQIPKHCVPPYRPN